MCAAVHDDLKLRSAVILTVAMHMHGILAICRQCQLYFANGISQVLCGVQNRPACCPSGFALAVDAARSLAPSLQCAAMFWRQLHVKRRFGNKLISRVVAMSAHACKRNLGSKGGFCMQLFSTRTFLLTSRKNVRFSYVMSIVSCKQAKQQVLLPGYIGKRDPGQMACRVPRAASSCDSNRHAVRRATWHV